MSKLNYLFLWAYLAIYADLSYPICGLRAVTNISEFSIKLLILSLLA
jgi:hypothetical protein